MAKAKRVPKGSKVKYKTTNAWGTAKHSGIVVSFIPCGDSAIAKMPAKLRTSPGAFKGSDTSSLNDRYLMKFEEDGKVFYRAPRAPRIEKAFFGEVKTSKKRAA